MASKAGLIGVFQPPKDRNEVSSVYMISDETSHILFIFVLFPGAYMDAYEVASQETYTNIFIVPVSMDALYVSDVVRLANDLIPYKRKVKIIFPGKSPSFMPTAVQKALIKGGRTTFYQYTFGFVGLNYQIGKEIYQPNFYDIYATFKNRRLLFCPFDVNKERILKMLQNNKVDWVYLPYSKPLFGSDCFATLVKDPDFEPYLDKLVAIGFTDQTHANFCRLRFPNNYPRTIRNAFLNLDNYLSSETGNPVVVGGVPTYTDEDDPDITPIKPEVKPPHHPDMPFPRPLPPEKPEATEFPETNGEINLV